MVLAHPRLAMVLVTIVYYIVIIRAVLTATKVGAWDLHDVGCLCQPLRTVCLLISQCEAAICETSSNRAHGD